MAITDFFQALANPQVQDQLAALSYAYGPQYQNNGVGARFANYTDYLKQQKNAALEQRMFQVKLDQQTQALKNQKEQDDREEAARTKLQQNLNAAQLVQNLPTAEQDRQGAPAGNAPLGVAGMIDPMLQYMADTGDIRGAGYLMQQKQSMANQDRLDQAALLKEHAIQGALQDPNLRKQLGPAAEILLRTGGTALGRGLFPRQGTVGAGAGTTGMVMPNGTQIGEGVFGKSDTGRLRNIVFQLAPYYQQGTLSPELKRTYEMARVMLDSSMTAGKDEAGDPSQKGDLGTVIGDLNVASARPGGTQTQQPQPSMATQGGAAQTLRGQGNIPPQPAPTPTTDNAGIMNLPPLGGPSIFQSIASSNVGGPINRVIEAAGKFPEVGHMVQNPAVQSAQDYARQTRLSALRSLQQAKNFPVSELKWIEGAINGLEPEFMQSKESYRTGAASVARQMQERYDAAVNELGQKIPPERRQTLMTLTQTIPRILQSIGAYSFNSPEDAQNALNNHSVPEGSLIRYRKSDGTWGEGIAGNPGK